MAVDLTRIGKWHAGLVLGSGAVTYATHVGEPGSLLLGGTLMGANFWLLRLLTGAVCRGAADPAKGRYAGLAIGSMVLKSLLFLVLLGGLFVRLPIEGMSFAAGVTLLLVACVIEAAYTDIARRKGVAGGGTS